MQLTDTQHRILVALCRPATGGNGFAPPATNQEIADEVFLSVDAVKAHLRTLYRKFGIEELPQNQKRARLVELVVEGGYLERGLGRERPPGPGRLPPPVPRSALPTPPRPPGQAAGPSPVWQFSRSAPASPLVALVVLALAGAFSSDDSEADRRRRLPGRGARLLPPRPRRGERPPRRRRAGSAPAPTSR